MKHPIITRGYKIGDIKTFSRNYGANKEYILATDRNFRPVWIEYEKVSTRVY